MSEPVIMPLAKPIQAHGEEITSLTFRPMIAKDIRQCGIPFTMTEHGQRFDASVVTKLIVACAGIPTSSLDQMELGDFQAAIGVILGFWAGSSREPPST